MHQDEVCTDPERLGVSLGWLLFQTPKQLCTGTTLRRRLEHTYNRCMEQFRETFLDENFTVSLRVSYR